MSLAVVTACSYLRVSEVAAQAQVAGPDEDPLAAVVAAERAFAAASEQVGVREAFLRYAAEDALLFRPEPANARQTWEARPSPPIRLTWYPGFARAAASGDLGFTTGPFEVLDTARAGAEPGYGHYVTVWRREPAGWRFVLDVGTSHPALEPRPAPWQPPAASRPASADADPPAEAVRGSLLREDSAFSRTAEQVGVAEALSRFGADEARLHRPGILPAVGRAAAMALAGRDARRYHAETIGGAGSRAGDFGYTYGRYRLTDTGGNGRHESGHYVRIWIREPLGPWRLLLDVVNPRPAEREE
jgi:ketosteroid isomerase-like protein